MIIKINDYMGVSENRLNPEKPNGFADHYPVGNIHYFQTNPYDY